MGPRDKPEDDNRTNVHSRLRIVVECEPLAKPLFLA